MALIVLPRGRSGSVNARRRVRSGFDVGFGRGGNLFGRSRQQDKVLRSMVEQRVGSVKPLPIRTAAITSPGRAIAVRIATRVFGSRASQVQAVARQQLRRIPGPAKVGAIGAGVFGIERGIEATTGRSPAAMIFDATRGRGRDVFDIGKQPRRQAVARDSRAHPSRHEVVRTWQTFPGGPVFERYSDGHIEVQRKDGTIKTFRPYRPVVIPRKWNARSMSRVATALKRQRKTATKILRLTGGVPTKKVRVSGRAHRSVDVDD